MALSIVNVENGSKSYQYKVLFSDASFYLQEGEKVALIGKNGGGKSTLLRIIAGEEQLDSGTVVKKRNLKISYLRQETKFPDEEKIIDVLKEHFQIRMDDA